MSQAAHLSPARAMVQKKFKDMKGGQFRVNEFANSNSALTLARKELAAYAFLCRQAEAKAWMEAVLGVEMNLADLPADAAEHSRYKSDLYPALRDGQLLCQVLNKIKEGLVKRVAKSQGKPFLMLENTNAFLAGCRTIEVPEHKMFLPLDLHERQNMPRVIYCIHELAEVAYSKYGLSAKIEDQTGKAKFDDDDLHAAAKELNEELPKKQKKPEIKEQADDEEQRRLAQEAIDAANRRHNLEQIERSRRRFLLNQLSPIPLLMEGFSKAEDVTGDKDNGYALNADITFMDGEVRKRELIHQFNVGTHDFEKGFFYYQPPKPVREVLLEGSFDEPHKGKIWFERFDCVEDTPNKEFIHFLQNPSFEIPESKNPKRAAMWTPKGEGYTRTDAHATKNGMWSATMHGSDCGCVDTAHVYQNVPHVLVVEAYSRANRKVEEIKKSSKPSKSPRRSPRAPAEGPPRYGVMATVRYSDGTEQQQFLGWASSEHDWERKQYILRPEGKFAEKKVKEIDVHCQFKNHYGKVYFDHVSVYQEKSRQLLLNPGFEIPDTDDDKRARFWHTDGNVKYERNQDESCVYGNNSIVLTNDTDDDVAVARQEVDVNQKKPQPLSLEAYSKATAVGAKNDKAKYEVTVDFEFDDGTKSTERLQLPLKDDWERSVVRCDAKKPVKRAVVECRLAGAKGARVYLDNVTLSEEFVFGESRIANIQRQLLDMGDFEENWLKEMQALKEKMIDLIRRNHLLEIELKRIDNRIGLLVKNRGDLAELLRASKRAFKLLRTNKRKKHDVDQTDEANDCLKHMRSKLPQYEELFYALQTDLKYIAKLLYVISPDQMKAFLETVLLTLFGDNFSPREEFLYLKLLQHSIELEIKAYKDVSGFLGDSGVITKLVVSYNKREHGKQYLQSTFSSLVREIVAQKDTLDTELSPLKIYQRLVAAGTPDLQSSKNDAEAYSQNAAVAKQLDANLKSCITLAEKFLKLIFGSVEQLPYGLRWICKKIKAVATAQFKNTEQSALYRIFGYFVYYRFINPAIVAPETTGVLDMILDSRARNNLVQIGRVLSAVFNFSSAAHPAHLKTITEFISSNSKALHGFMEQLTTVPEPADQLGVDDYIELTAGTKPVIIISYDEIYSTHELLLQVQADVCDKDDDTLVPILKDLGALPEYNLVDGDTIDARLVLRNRHAQKEAESLANAKMSPADAARKMAIDLLRIVPVAKASELNSLGEIIAAMRGVEDDKIKTLVENVDRAVAALAESAKCDRDAALEMVLSDIQRHIANIATVQAQRLNELNRLRQAVAQLEATHDFMKEQLESYQMYLQTAREKSFMDKKKKRKKQQGERTLEISYKQLHKDGTIIRSQVPSSAQKGTVFTITPSTDKGIFIVKAKMAKITVHQVELSLDELLELQQSDKEEVEVGDGDVVLHVNKTILLLNKNFLGAKK